MSVVLEVAIGLVLMYALLSLMVTSVVEIISTLSSFRARSLAKAIRQLIFDKDIRERFYKHGLIESAAATAKGGVKPADVPENATPNRLNHPSYIDGRAFAAALLDSLDTRTGEPLNFAAAETRIKALKDTKLQDVLLTALSDAEGDLGKLRDGVANWFDGSMDRLSGSFTRFNKYLALGVGLAVAVALNADTIAVTRILWTDEAARAKAVEAAGLALQAQSGADAECPVDKDDQLKSLACLSDALSKRQAALDPLPIGWTTIRSEELFGKTSADGKPEARTLPAALSAWFFKIVGVLMTAIALSLGAPFWFDLLQNLMNLRGTGPKPKKTQSV